MALGVSLDRLPEAARAFVSAVGLSEVVPLWGSFEQALAVARVYRVTTIPHVFLIDRRRVIRYAGPPAGLTSELIEYWRCAERRLTGEKGVANMAAWSVRP